MIESRYTIEYVNPETSEGGVLRKKHYALFIILGIVIASALLFAILSIGKSNQLIRVSDQTPTSLSTIDSTATKPEVITPPPANVMVEMTQEIEKQPEPTQNSQIILASFDKDKVSAVQQEINILLEQNKAQQSQADQQLASNKALTDSLNVVTKQLMAEREKNKVLDKQLSSKKAENNQLSEMLNNAISNASTEDKTYLSSLNKTEEQAPLPQKKEITKSDSNIIIVGNIAGNDSTTKTIDHYNSVNLSTVSQMDAIIAVMNGAKPKKSVITSQPTNPTAHVQLAAISKTETELLHIQLQNQINQMLNGSTPSPAITQYKKALATESNIRQNAVRSITIRKGETLWGIAQRAYGNGSKYKRIIEANPQININLLREGQVIRVPN